MGESRKSGKRILISETNQVDAIAYLHFFADKPGQVRCGATNIDQIARERMGNPGPFEDVKTIHDVKEMLRAKYPNDPKLEPYIRKVSLMDPPVLYEVFFDAEGNRRIIESVLTGFSDPTNPEEGINKAMEYLSTKI